MKTLRVSVTQHVELEVPDDFAVSAEDIARIASWKLNDERDGRYPYSHEMVKDGIHRLVRDNLEETLFQHYCRVYEQFVKGNVEKRNKIVAGEVSKVCIHLSYALDIREEKTKWEYEEPSLPKGVST